MERKWAGPSQAAGPAPRWHRPRWGKKEGPSGQGTGAGMRAGVSCLLHVYGQLSDSVHPLFIRKATTMRRTSSTRPVSPFRRNERILDAHGRWLQESAVPALAQASLDPKRSSSQRIREMTHEKGLGHQDQRGPGRGVKARQPLQPVRWMRTGSASRTSCMKASQTVQITTKATATAR